MKNYRVTRAHLRSACDNNNWDLLDRLLEIDSSLINDNSLFTDDWGLWWGMLFELVQRGSVDGVKVLLKHGAQRNLACWGDGLIESPSDIASEKPEILRLLQSSNKPGYKRSSNPDLPESLSSIEQAINRQGEISKATGLQFHTDAFLDD